LKWEKYKQEELKYNEKMGLNKAGSEFVDDGIDWHSFIVV